MGRFPEDQFLDTVIWPSLKLHQLPRCVQNLLIRVPNTSIGQNGYLHLANRWNNTIGRIPLAQTQWNFKRSKPQDELFPDFPWGIVLHWYGDPNYFDRSVKGYLRGFNGVRSIDDYETQTSAHFLVGDGFPSMQISLEDDFWGFFKPKRHPQMGCLI